jgi:hypothetical protein
MLRLGYDVDGFNHTQSISYNTLQSTDAVELQPLVAVSKEKCSIVRTILQGYSLTHLLTYSLTHSLTHSLGVTTKNGKMKLLKKGKCVTTPLVAREIPAGFTQIQITMEDSDEEEEEEEEVVLFTHSLTHSLTYLLTYSLTHSHTHSLIGRGSEGKQCIHQSPNNN